MIKGCKKRMIFIKDTKSDYFDEAYFVLKGDVEYKDSYENDFVMAATRIINNIDGLKKHESKKNRKFPKFLLGVLVGASLSSIIFTIISIFC